MAAAVETPKRKTKAKHGDRSNKIREYLENHPEMGPTAIAKTLTAQGLKVSPTLVSNVKARLETMGKKKRGRPAAGGKFDFASLVEAKKFAEQVGSIAEARRILDMLAKLS